MLHKKQNAHTQAHKKASLLQRPKPHHLMNCERAVRHRRAALSQFGGRGGTSSPHKKTLKELRHHFVDVFEIGFVVLGTW